MIKLLRFELHKLFRQKAFYICLGIAAVLGALSLYTYYKNELGIFGDAYDGALALLRAVDNSELTMFLGIFAAIFVCEDYSGGTIRSIVSRGYTRTEIYLSKLITLLLGTVIMFAVCCVCCGVTGAILWDMGEHETALMLKLLLIELLLTVAYACLFNAISSALQKTGISVAVCVILPIVMILILSFVELTFFSSDTAEEAVNIGKYWLGDMMSSVNSFDAGEESIKLACIAAPIYIAVCAVLGWFSIIKREY